MSSRVERASETENPAQEVSRISSSAMLSEAADRMRILDTVSLPVVENNEIIGRITNRDIVQAVSVGLNPTTTPVKQAMTSDATPRSRGGGRQRHRHGGVRTRRTL